MSVALQPIPATSPPAPAIPDVPIHRLTVAQYLAMGEAGILTEEDRVELLEGWLAEKMTKHPPHASMTRRLRRILEHALPAGWLVLSQDPILTGDSAPEPDLAVVQGDEATFQHRHPLSREVAVVIEVADSSLQQDRGMKKRLYARAGIAVYWIVNLVGRQIEVHTDPTGPVAEPDYRQHRNYGPDDTLPVMLAGVEVAGMQVQELLP